MKKENQSLGGAVIKKLLDMNEKRTKHLFILYGLVIALVFFIIEFKTSPEKGFWGQLIGAIVGMQLLAYFVGWKQHLKKHLIPLRKDIEEIVAEPEA